MPGTQIRMGKIARRIFLKLSSPQLLCLGAWLADRRKIQRSIKVWRRHGSQKFLCIKGGSGSA